MLHNGGNAVQYDKDPKLLFFKVFDYVKCC